MRQSLFGRSNPERKIELKDSFVLEQLLNLINNNKWELFTSQCIEIQKKYTSESIIQKILKPSVTLRFQNKKYDSALALKLIASNPPLKALKAFCGLSDNIDSAGFNSVAISSSSADLLSGLEIAYLLGNYKAIEYLLKHGANPNIPRQNESSLLSFTCYRDKELQINDELKSIPALLQEFGATFTPYDFSDFSYFHDQDYYIDLQGLSVKTDISKWNLFEANLIDTDLSESIGANHCFINDSVYSPQTKFPENFHPFSHGMKRAHFDRASNSWSYFPKGGRSFNTDANDDQIIDLLPRQFAGKALDLSSRTAQLLMNLANETYRELYDIHAADPSALIALMPSIQATDSAKDLHAIVFNLEKRLDRYFESRLFYNRKRAVAAHPMEPELMAALGMIDFADEGGTSALTRVLTAQTQWISLGDSIPRHKITDVLALTWAELGRLSLSFKKWKFDAISPSITDGELKFRIPSVFEQFGFQTIKRTSDKEYLLNGKLKHPGLGTGAILSQDRINILSSTEVKQNFCGLRKFSKNTHLELRHGYILISVAGLGTLIIRNSSTDFGRDRLKFTASYSPKDITSERFEDHLLEFDHGVYNDYFRSIFNRDFSRINNPAHKNIKLLLGHLLHFEKCFDDWKFDSNPTTAFRKSVLGHYDLVGGYNSEGFKYVLDIARAIFENNPKDSNLAFAFYQKGKIPYFAQEFASNLPYILGEQSYGHVLVDTLPVTQERLDLLQALITQDDSIPDLNERLQESGIRNFLQQAGFDQHGCISLTNIWSNEKW